MCCPVGYGSDKVTGLCWFSGSETTIRADSSGDSAMNSNSMTITLLFHAGRIIPPNATLVISITYIYRDWQTVVMPLQVRGVHARASPSANLIALLRADQPIPQPK